MAWLGCDQPHPEVQRMAWKTIDISPAIVTIVVSALEHELLHICICMQVERTQSGSQPQTLRNPNETCISHMYLHMYMYAIGTIERSSVADLVEPVDDNVFMIIDVRQL